MQDDDRLERATESTLAKAITRFGVPALLVLLGSAGSLLLSDIRASVSSLEESQTIQGTELRQMSNDVQLLNAKVDNGLLWRIGELERRVNAVENR